MTVRLTNIVGRDVKPDRTDLPKAATVIFFCTVDETVENYYIPVHLELRTGEPAKQMRMGRAPTAEPKG